MKRSVAGVALPTWLFFGLPAAAALALYAPVVPGLVHDWSQFPSLSHGFAVPLIAGYLVWARRGQLVSAPIVPLAWGLPVLMVGLAVLVVGVRAEESFVARVSLPLILFGLSLSLGGATVTRRAWPGILYLLLMVPLPWSTLKLVTYRSRLIDAEASATALSWLGVPVYRDGVMLYLPNIALEVADECSSIPAIAALLALGVAYASLTRRSVAGRVLLVAVTVPVAIVSNIIRITGTAAATYYIGPWVLQTIYHQLTGTTNFLITFLLLLGLDSLVGRLAERSSR